MDRRELCQQSYGPVDVSSGRWDFLRTASVGDLIRDHNRLGDYWKEFYNNLPTVYLDVDPSRILFTHRPAAIQKVMEKARIDAIDPFGTSQRVKKRGFRFAQAGKEGRFVFYPERLYLLRTRHFVTIPPDKRYELKPFFSVVRKDSAERGWLEELPITTNISASILQPGDIARIAYEAINTSTHPIEVNVGDLLAQAYVVPLSTTPDVTGEERHGRFSTQLRDIRI